MGWVTYDFVQTIIVHKKNLGLPSFLFTNTTGKSHGEFEGFLIPLFNIRSISSLIFRLYFWGILRIRWQLDLYEVNSSVSRYGKSAGVRSARHEAIIEFSFSKIFLISSAEDSSKCAVAFLIYSSTSIFSVPSTFTSSKPSPDALIKHMSYGPSSFVSELIVCCIWLICIALNISPCIFIVADKLLHRSCRHFSPFCDMRCANSPIAIQEPGDMSIKIKHAAYLSHRVSSNDQVKWRFRDYQEGNLRCEWNDRNRNLLYFPSDLSLNSVCHGHLAAHFLAGFDRWLGTKTRTSAHLRTLVGLRVAHNVSQAHVFR